MSRMRRAVSSSSFSSAQWMKGPQDYIEWGTVKRIVKKQIAKAVTECKTRAETAKQLVGDLKTKRLSTGHEHTRVGVVGTAGGTGVAGVLAGAAGTQDDYEDGDLSVSDIDGDTDFEDGGQTTDDDDDDHDSVAQYSLDMPHDVMPTDKAISPDYGCHGSPSELKDDASSLGSDASSYASASSNGLQVGGVQVKRPPMLPRPAIPTKPLALRPRRKSAPRPTTQPPPPPIPTQPPPVPLSESSEDYEVPLCHGTDSEASSSVIYDEQSATYEQIEHLEETYEVVREGNNYSNNSVFDVDANGAVNVATIHRRRRHHHHKHDIGATAAGPVAPPLATNCRLASTTLIATTTTATGTTTAATATTTATSNQSSPFRSQHLPGVSQQQQRQQPPTLQQLRRPLTRSPSDNLRLNAWKDAVQGAQAAHKPPLLPRQNSSPLGLLPAPPRPKTLKPPKTPSAPSSCCSTSTGTPSSPPTPSLHRATPLVEKNYDTLSLNSLVNRPLPPVPTAENVYADVHFRDEVPMPHALSVYPWFHDVEREDVDRILRDVGEQGSFLVRISRRGGPTNPFTLSLLHEGRIFHLNIRKRPDGSFALGSAKTREKTFATVSELIEHHRQEEILLTSRNQPAGSTRLTTTYHVGSQQAVD